MFGDHSNECDISVYLALATGANNSKVPFKKMAEKPTHYVSALQLPKGISFKDPSHYKVEETFEILRLWRQRQAKGEIPFRFGGIILAGGKFGGTDYATDLFDGLRIPVTNSYGKPTAQPARLEPVSEQDKDSMDEVGLPQAAWGEPESDVSDSSVGVDKHPRSRSVRRPGHTVMLSEEEVTPPPSSHFDSDMEPVKPLITQKTGEMPVFPLRGSRRGMPNNKTLVSDSGEVQSNRQIRQQLITCRL